MRIHSISGKPEPHRVSISQTIYQSKLNPAESINVLTFVIQFGWSDAQFHLLVCCQDRETKTSDSHDYFTNETDLCLYFWLQLQILSI